jgi:hypothetical protein
MADINHIKKDSDISHAHLMGWDLQINGKDYAVYSISGFNHTLGGKWGENHFWTCPNGEVPTYENLIQFSGTAPTWGVFFEESNYTKFKWDEHSVERGSSCWITRNGEKFYHVMGRDMAYALSKAQYFLTQLQEECPLYLNERNWKVQAAGMKIWYDGEPAIIESVTSSNDLWIVPEAGKSFKTPAGWEDEEYDEYRDGLVADLLSPNISWFRD